MHDLTQSILRAIRIYVYRIGGESLPVVVVELLLIGVVVWLVMRFLRGTRGARLVKGVAVLLVTVYVVILMLPEELGWERIKLLYGGFLIFTFIAVVVAFQPEIRRALIQIGQARLFRNVTHEAKAVVDALVDSAAYLSRNKTGAIVAVERTVGLGALVEAGTPVDAQLTAGLLNTIFYPGSALHDMGVVISNGRIAAAGCQFPLAESEEVDPSLGSRHRAALGLSKECDAALIVVSEETGRISLACEGQLYVGLDLENLREMLNALLAPDETRRRAKETGAEKTGTTE